MTFRLTIKKITTDAIISSLFTASYYNFCDICTLIELCTFNDLTTIFSKWMSVEVIEDFNMYTHFFICFTNCSKNMQLNICAALSCFVSVPTSLHCRHHSS